VVYVAWDGLGLVAQVTLRARVVTVTADLDDARIGTLPGDGQFDAAVDVAEVAGRLVPGER
jgi:hypothetical protein